MSNISAAPTRPSLLTKAAMTALAAERAEQVMTTIVGAFSLLVEEMADLNTIPDADKVNEWCNITCWLTSQLQGECKNIRLTLKDDES